MEGRHLLPVFLLHLAQNIKFILLTCKGEYMKTFKPVTPCLLVFVSLWISFLMIGITSCGEDDDNKWVGTWTLETVDGESTQAQFEAIELLFESLAEAFGGDETDIDISYTDEWTFDDDGAWDREATIVALNFDDTIETISIEGVGTYSLSGPNYTITLKSVQGHDSDLGTVQEIDFGYEDTDTGTWLINGDILTLTSDNGYVLGFKKK